jgi:hypothetical protein
MHFVGLYLTTASVFRVTAYQRVYTPEFERIIALIITRSKPEVGIIIGLSEIR